MKNMAIDCAFMSTPFFMEKKSWKEWEGNHHLKRTAAAAAVANISFSGDVGIDCFS